MIPLASFVITFLIKTSHPSDYAKTLIHILNICTTALDQTFFLNVIIVIVYPIDSYVTLR